MAVTLKNSALKELLKSRGVKNYSSANKDQLLKMVEASGGLPHDAPAEPAPAPAAAEPVAAEPKSPKKAKKVKKVKVVEEPAEVHVEEEPVKKVKKVKKDKSPSPEKKPAVKKAKKSVDLKVDVSQ